MDVAIVGVGLHPFGRFPDGTGIDMGAIAIRRALEDAGVAWRDIQFAFGGSYEVDNPDAVVAFLGLTGIPFTDVYNGCATAASARRIATAPISIPVVSPKRPKGWRPTPMIATSLVMRAPLLHRPERERHDLVAVVVGAERHDDELHLHADLEGIDVGLGESCLDFHVAEIDVADSKPHKTFAARARVGR